MTDTEQSSSPNESSVFWRQDLGDGSYLYFLRKEDGGLYVEIRHGGVALDATIYNDDSLLEWLDRSRS